MSVCCKDRAPVLWLEDNQDDLCDILAGEASLLRTGSFVLICILEGGGTGEGAVST